MGPMIGWSRWALLLSGLAGLAYAVHSYSVSPATVPLHYGPSGVPDRWGTRGELLAVHVGIIGVGSALFLALPALLGRLPPSLVNLPNKHYWLAPERRAQTTLTLASWCGVVGTALNVFVVALQAAQGTGSSAPRAPMLGVTLAFVTFMLGACVWLLHAFRLPTELPGHR